MKNNIQRYELEARYDVRQSFYRKAYVEIDNDEHIISLLSYDTLVLVYDVGEHNGYVKILDEDYLTNTTLRHVKEFLKQFNLPTGTKQELIKMYCKD